MRPAHGGQIVTSEELHPDLAPGGPQVSSLRFYETHSLSPSWRLRSRLFLEEAGCAQTPGPLHVPFLPSPMPALTQIPRTPPRCLHRGRPTLSTSFQIACPPHAHTHILVPPGQRSLSPTRGKEVGAQ